jgi:hypothetical protein
MKVQNLMILFLHLIMQKHWILNKRKALTAIVLPEDYDSSGKEEEAAEYVHEKKACYL